MITRNTHLAVFFFVTGLAILLSILGGCRGWTMDYGNPAAQFEALDAATFGAGYLGRKVSVRGEVSAVDTSDPARCTVRLQHGVVANFGKFKAAAEACPVGEIVHLDGIVRAVDASSITLDPAFGRDPQAPFDPIHP
ncbi:MAG: hypothetical protein MK194_04915 [Roseibacillus sp.]|nr:hypothetical protein [Roseibacillus sp.]